MEEELIDESLDYEEYDLDEEQEKDQETDDLVQVSSGLKSSYQVHNDHYGNQVEIDDTSQYENEEVDDAGHYANQVEVDDSNYVDYQEDGAELLEHDALEEGDSDDEEEERGRGRDRFKSERTKISLITDGNPQREIPDSLDDVIQPSDTSLQENLCDKGKGNGRGKRKRKGRGRGQNIGMQQQGKISKQQRKILTASTIQQWPGQQPQFLQQFPTGPPMGMQLPPLHQLNPQPLPLMPMPGPAFQRLQGPNVFFNRPMFQDFSEDVNGEMFLAPNPSQNMGAPFSQGPHIDNNNGPNVFFNGPMFQDFSEDVNGEMFLAPNPSQNMGAPFSQGPHMNNNNISIGENAKLTCSPDYAYGAHGFPGVIPPNPALFFDVDLLGVDKTINEAKMEEELIDDSLDYEEYDLDEEQEEALLAEDQETDDLVQVSSGLKSSYQVHNDHYGNQVEIDDTSQYENEDVDDAGHYANQVEVDDSNYADEEGVNEQDNYVDYQEGDMEEQGDGAELLEHDALEEGDPDDEEEEEEEGRGRDRFKSERTKISLITVGNTQREIPDSLDDVIQPSDASNQKNWRGKGKGRGRGRGQNRGMQQQQQQRKILNAPRRQQWPGQQPQFFQQFPNGPPMRMQPPSFHQFNPQPRPLMPMPGPPFQRLQGPNVFFNGPMFQDFTEDMNGEMFLAPNPSQKRGDPFSQGPHMNNNNMYPNATRGRGQNFQNASRGRGQNLPNASRGMGQNQPNASRGRGQNQPNASRGMGQNQPNASRGRGQNQPNASPGRGQNQPNASRGRGGVAKHIPVHQRLSRPQPSDNVKGKNQNQNKSNLQEVPCKTIPKSPANKVPEKPPSPKLSEEELYQKRLEEQKAQRAKVLAMKEARRKETMEKEEESSTADAAPNSVAPKQAAPNPAASTPVAPKPVTAKPVAPKPAAPKPAAPQAVTAKPVVPKPAAPKPIQQNISVVLNTKTGPPKKKALARLGGPRPLHPKPQPIQQGHFNPRAGPPIVRQNMPRMGQMPPPRMSNSNISRPPLSHPQAAGQRFQMNPPNQFSQGIHPRAPAPFSTRLEPLHMAAPIRSNLPPLQSHSSLMQSRPPIHTRPPLQQRLMPPAPLPARHIQQNNSPYPDARPSPNLARPPPNFNGPSSSMGPRGPSPHQPPMSDVYARSETQFQRPAHHLPQGPPLHGSPLQRPPLQRAPPQHSPLQRPAPQLHPQQRAPPQRPPQQRPPPSYSFSNEQGYSEYDNVQRGYPQNNREWDQYDDRSYEVPSDGYDHYGNEVPMKTHPRPHLSELTQFSQGYAPSSMEPSPDLRSKLNFRGPLRQTVAVAQAPTQTAPPPPKPAPKMISTQKIQKRFKKIIRRNKNGDIISIKKVPLDGEGNPVGQEKYEFVNEDLLSFNTGGSAKRMKVMSPQEQVLNRPVKRVLQRPAVGPSGNGLSLRDGLPPTQFTRELAESAQRITSLVGRRHDDQANFQRMPSGDGRSLQPSGPTRRVIAEFPRREGAYPGRDFAVKLTPLPPRVRIQDLLQDSREQHKMMEFDDRLRQYKLSFHTHESAVRFCHFVNDLGIEISAFLVSA